ncbi:MAG: aldo/keto reductase [Methylobacteriaceae bacterium]|nr:aldo/keto reductase [Methylobacteriaceae bacterium]
MTMRDRITLPGTELSVSRICLGGNRFGATLDQDESFALLDAFVEAGGNFIDTAHIYANWVASAERSSSEKTIGRWLKARRPRDVVIATKGAHPGSAPGATPRLDAATILRELDESLTYLGLSRIDLHYVHRDEPERPVEEILATLETARRDGRIRHYAASNWSAARLEEAARVAVRRGWPGFVAHQPEWSLAQRNGEPGAHFMMDAALIAYHARTGLPVIPYSAQAKGYFDKARGGASPDRADDPAAKAYDNPVNRGRAAELATIAARHGATPTQVMLAAMIRAPFPTIPIAGCRTPDQARASLASLDVALGEHEAARLLGWVGLTPTRG